MARQVPGARLVHLGSAAEYGLPLVGGRPTVETDEPRPAAPYGETKLAGTRAVQAASIIGLDTVVLRVFNPVGAGMDARTLPGNAARRIAAAIAAGDDVIQLGPLGAARDFVAAGDVAAATVAAVLAPAAGGAVLNVGTGEARPARELVARLVEVSGWRGRIEEADEGSSRSGAVAWMAADVERTAGVLGWRAAVPFDDAVRALWSGVPTKVTVRS
jgi:nucleoside-diphosphate-sugar epimerase